MEYSYTTLYLNINIFCILIFYLNVLEFWDGVVAYVITRF